MRDTLAAAAQRQTGHPAGRAFVSPSHRRLTELKMARFGSDYDAVAGLDRFAGWLRTQAAGDSPPRTGRGPARPRGSGLVSGPVSHQRQGWPGDPGSARPTAATATAGPAVRTETARLSRQGATVTR